MPRASILLAALCLTLPACNRKADAAADRAPPDPTRAHPTLPTFQRCIDRGPPARSGNGFAHKRSLAIAAFPANHFVQDLIGHPSTSETLEAKVSYGDIGKDLEDETIEIVLDACDDWTSLGRAKTDDDGRAALDVDLPGKPGLYDLHAIVDGDATAARTRLTVAPKGTKIVVFDIDGTLTTRDIEITNDVVDDYYEDLYEGDYDAQAYDGGPALTRAWVDRGYLVVYLTGRPYWLVDKTRQWLTEHDFAPGLVHTTDRHRDVVPNVRGVGAFKAAYLKRLRALDYEIVAAYGNATTDVWAYEEAGVPKDRSFIIGPHAGAGGTVKIEGDWMQHRGWVQEQPAAVQPFAW